MPGTSVALSWRLRDLASSPPPLRSGWIACPIFARRASIRAHRRGKPPTMHCMNGSAVLTTRSADTTARPAFTMFDSLDALPAACDALFASGAAEGVFNSREWYRTVVRHALPQGARPRFLLASLADLP